MSSCAAPVAFADRGLDKKSWSYVIIGNRKSAFALGPRLSGCCESSLLRQTDMHVMHKGSCLGRLGFTRS